MSELSDQYFWIVKILIALALLFFLIFLDRRIVTFFQKKLEQKENHWAKYLTNIFYYPFQLLLWIIALSYICLTIGETFQVEGINKYIPLLRTIAIVVTACWFTLRVNKSFKHVLSHQKFHRLDSISLDLLSKILALVIFFITLLIILQLLGINILPLLTVGGIGAAILGFASKDVIANFFGGVMIYATRPFFKGDLVEIPAQNIEGHVEDIGWYSTCIRNLHKRPIYVPNSLFSNNTIINQSRMSHRKLEEKISISYKDFSKIIPLLRDIRKLLHDDPEIDQHYTPLVFFTSYETYSLELFIKAYTISTKEEEYYQIKQNLLLQIGHILDQNNVQHPLPTSKVELIKD